MRIITDNLGMIGSGLATTLGIALLAYAGALVDRKSTRLNSSHLR